VKNSDYLSSVAFAKEIGIPARTVRHWCTKQLIPAEKTETNRYLVPAYCVDLFREGILPLVSD